MLKNKLLLYNLLLPLITAWPASAQEVPPAKSPPSFSYGIYVNVSGERLSQTQSVEYYRQQGGGVFWLPDMKVAGKIFLYNQGGTEFVLRSVAKKIDPLKWLSVTGALVNGKNVSPAQLPPIHYTFSSTELVDDEPEIVLQTFSKRIGSGAVINFKFRPAANYKWEEGEYLLTFKLDPLPDTQKAELLTAMFRIKYIHSEEDLLNVAVWRYEQISRESSMDKAGARQREHTEGLEILNTLLLKYPDNTYYLHQRSMIYGGRGEYQKSIDDMQRIVELLKKQGGSQTETGGVSEITPRADVKYFESMIRSAKWQLQTATFLDALTAASSDDDKRRARNELINNPLVIQIKALDAAQRANIPNVIPVFLNLMNTPSNNELSIILRQKTWEVLTQMRPEARQVAYDPVAPEAERKAAVDKLREVLKLK